MSTTILNILKKIIAKLNEDYNTDLKLHVTENKSVIIDEPHIYDDGCEYDGRVRNNLPLKWFSFYYSGCLCLSKFLTPCEIALAEINLKFIGV